MPTSSVSWLSSLQAQYLKGEFTDLTLRVKLKTDIEAAAAAAAAADAAAKSKGNAAKDPAAKKRRTASSSAAAAAAPAAAAEEEAGAAPAVAVTEIRCHAAVLAARSAYFRSCLTGQWREAQAKTIELQLDDEQQLADFRLLLKLSYTDSYTKDQKKDKKKLLGRATRLRLAVLADGFEMKDCVTQCLESLGEDLDFEEAVDCLDDLPVQFQEHEAADALKVQVVNVLKDGFEEFDQSCETYYSCNDPEFELFCKAGDVLAKLLAPVHEQFVGGFTDHYDSGDEFYLRVPLVAVTRDMPLLALFYLLKSDHLKCLSENDVYYFLGGWCMNNRGHYDERQLRILLREVRFSNMDQRYLASVVAPCSLLSEAEALPLAMHLAIVGRLGRRADISGGVSWGLPPGEAVWEFSTSISLEKCSLVGERATLHHCLGVAAGYPLYLRLRRGSTRVGAGLVRTFGVYIYVETPPWPLHAYHSDAVQQSAKVEARVCLADSGQWKTKEALFDGKGDWGWDDWFGGKTWDQVVREGGPYFRDGEMNVEVEIKVVVD